MVLVVSVNVCVFGSLRLCVYGCVCMEISVILNVLGATECIFKAL